MHNLCVLDLSEVPVSDFGMAKLAELPLLQKLTLLQCHRITRAGLLWDAAEQSEPCDESLHSIYHCSTLDKLPAKPSSLLQQCLLTKYDTQDSKQQRNVL